MAKSFTRSIAASVIVRIDAQSVFTKKTTASDGDAVCMGLIMMRRSQEKRFLQEINMFAKFVANLVTQMIKGGECQDLTIPQLTI